MHAIWRIAFLFLLWLIAGAGLYASHVLGGEITHKFESGNRYSFQVVVYRNCAECAFNTNNCSDIPDLEIVGSLGTLRAGQRLASVALTRTSVRDITPLCKGQLSRCDTSTGFPSGIEAWTFSGSYDFSNLLLIQCEFDATIRVDSRSDAWGTAEYYYNYSRLNLCNSIRNVSPSLETVAPVFLLAQNEAFRYNMMAVDADGDSLSYRLGTALRGYERSLVYPSGLSSGRPITAYCASPPLCNPNPASNPPSGIWFDSLNGGLICTPVSSGERGFLVIEIIEWRMLSGKMTRVGITRRDVQFLVTAVGNHMPDITTSGIPEWLCAGEESCFDVYFTDKAFGTRSDSLRYGMLTDATGSKIFTGSSRPGFTDAGFCWKPSLADVRTKPYVLKTWAADNACPLNLYTWKTWNLRVARKLDATVEVFLDTCGTLRMKATPASEHSKHQFNWFIFNEKSDLIAQRNGRNQFLRLDKGGVIVARLELIDGLSGCKTIISDTVQVPMFERPSLVLQFADSLCPGSSWQVEAKVSKGRTPYVYWWNGIPGGTRFLAVMPAKGTLQADLMFSDGMGCAFKASAFSKSIVASPMGLRDTSICSSSPALELEPLLTRKPTEQVYFSLLAGVSYLSGSAPSTWLNHNGTPGKSRCLAFYTDRSGCLRTDTNAVSVTELPATGLKLLDPVCQGTRFVPLRKASGLLLPGGKWSTSAGSVSGDTLYIHSDANGAYPLTFRLTYGGCEIVHDDVFRVLPRPVFSVAASVPETVCVPAPLRLTLASEPAGAQWSGLDVAANQLSLQPKEGARIVYGQYRDPSTGCAATISHRIEVYTPVLITSINGWNDKVCAGQYLDIEVQANQPAIFAISSLEADALSATDAPEFRFFSSPQPGYYPLRITARSNAVCPATDTQLQVEVVPAPSGKVSAAQMSGCAPFGLQLLLTADEPDRVSWQLGDINYIGVGKTYFQAIPDARSMMVYCTVEKNGCKTTLALADSIRVYRSPEASFDVMPGTVLDLDYATAAFLNTSVSTDNFISKWYFSGPRAWESDLRDPEVNFPLEGLYDVRLFIATEKGCTSIASDQVRVEPRVQHFVPNAFTPDRKGPESNELFMPVIDRNVQEYSFMVFNRWGEKVFSSTLPQEGWNALRHGKPLAAGSYAWQLRYYTLSGREVNDSGVVLLIR